MAEADGDAPVRFGGLPDRGQIVDRRGAELPARKVLRRLHRRPECRSAPQMLDDDLGALVRFDDRGGAGRAHPSVIEALRQNDDVRREAISADVRALPRGCRARPGERGRDGPAPQGAARVVAPVCAHEVARVG